MVAFFKSDLFAKFMGGFVLGTVAILTLQPSDEPRPGASTSASATPAAQDAQL